MQPSAENPSSNPSSKLSANPSFVNIGNVYVNWYDVSLNALPEEGLKSLQSYDDGYVPNIDFRLSSSDDTFSTSGKRDHFAGLFEGELNFDAAMTYLHGSFTLLHDVYQCGIFVIPLS